VGIARKIGEVEAEAGITLCKGNKLEVIKFQEKPQHSKRPQRVGSKLLATIQATGVVT